MCWSRRLIPVVVLSPVARVCLYYVILLVIGPPGSLCLSMSTDVPKSRVSSRFVESCMSQRRSGPIMSASVSPSLSSPSLPLCVFDFVIDSRWAIVTLSLVLIGFWLVTVSESLSLWNHSSAASFQAHPLVTPWIGDTQRVDLVSRKVV